MKAILIAASVAALAAPLLPLQAATAPAAANRDVRCLMLSNLFSKAAAVAQAKEAAGQSRLFYLGRVSDKYTAARLEAAMSAEAKSIDPDKAGPDMNKCLASVQAAAAAVEAAGHKAAESKAPATATTPAHAAAGPPSPAGSR